MTKWTKEEEDILIRYWGKIKISELAILLPNRTNHSLQHRASSLKLKGNRGLANSNPKYSVNHQYFFSPNIENSYWAGFIAADGCVRYRSEYSQNLQIHLQYKDRNHIEKFKNYIKFNGRILDELSNKQLVASKIEIPSIQLCTDLLQHWNITPKKSLTLQSPNLVDRLQILSYIVGYIDGDGCIYPSWNKLILNIIGTEACLIWIKSQFNNLGTISRRPNKKWFSYTICGGNCRIILRELKSHIEKYNLPVLSRKWNKVTEEQLRDGWTTKHYKIKPEFVYREIFINKKSRRQLAKELNCDKKTISNRLKEYEKQFNIN